MNNRKKYTLIILALIVGTACFFVRAERQIISLPPEDALPLTLPITPDTTYFQEFVVHEDNITAVGLYLRPLAQDLPADSAVVLSLRQNEAILASGQTPARFIQPDAPTMLPIPGEVSIIPGSTLQLHVSISDAISGKIGVIQRPQDETFNREAVLHVGEEALDDPAAYVAFSRVRPQITSHITGLLLVIATLLFVQKGARQLVAYAVLLPIAAALPILPHTSKEFLFLVAAQIVGLYLFVFYRLRQGLPLPAVLFGAHTAIFTTFWPLAIIAGYPLFDATILASVAHFRDIFLDPNQIVVTPIGAYISIPVLLAGLFGVVLLIMQYVATQKWHQLLMFLLVFLGGFVVSPIIPLLVFAYASATGFAKGMSFLGEDDMLVRVLSYAVVILVLIELWSPYARVLQELL